MFDCIVIGAGPAGGTAAWALAKAGWRVLAIDGSDEWPRSRVCGGGVAPVVSQWLDGIDLAAARSGKVQNLRLSWKFKDPVDLRLAPNAALWAVDRSRFDDCLMQAAIASGAEFRPQTRVTDAVWDGEGWAVTAGGRVETARYLVVADGPNGRGATWLGLEPFPCRPGIAINVRDPESTDAPRAYFDFGSLKNGAVWSIPLVDRGQRTVCAVSARAKERPDRLEAAVRAAIEQLGLDAIGDPMFQPVRLWDGNRPLHGHHAVLVGDAAGVADPFSYEGVRPAVWTGLRAAEAIGGALGGDAPAISRYSEVVAEELGADMAWAKRLTALFHSMPKLIYKLGTGRPSVNGYIGRMICGEMRYSYVADRAIARLTGLIGGNLFGSKP